jgi:hypothetical protein
MVNKLDLLKRQVKNISNADIELQTAYFRKYKSILRSYFKTEREV